MDAYPHLAGCAGWLHASVLAKTCCPPEMIQPHVGLPSDSWGWVTLDNPWAPTQPCVSLPVGNVGCHQCDNALDVQSLW